MPKKTLPLNSEEMIKLASSLETPFHLYDEKAIVDNAKNIMNLFSWAPNFTNYFAVKALPNPSILKVLGDLGFGTDCSSLPELKLSELAGITGERIMFSSNDTPAEEYEYAAKIGAIINVDDITHIDFIEKALGKLPKKLCFRYNPGPDRTGNAIIGNPIEAKYGVTKDQIVDCYKIAKEKGVEEFGLHTMVASNERNGEYIVETARMLFSIVNDVYQKTGIKISFIDMGGGVGIPYKEEDEAMDLSYVSERMKNLYEEIIVSNGLAPLSIAFECGRVITGPYGYLITKVLHVAKKYKDYVGVDACMTDLMRPGLYGAYHHITVLGKENDAKDFKYDVTGSLCENNDKFAIDRMLPEVNVGDYLVIHDTGAHGFAMGFNYNAKLKNAEYLLREDKTVRKIRRKETYEDYTRTIIFEGLNNE